MGGLSAPTVYDGTVYTIGQFDDPTVYAVNASDGTENWRFENDAEIEDTLALAEGVVFVVDQQSTVHALDASNGDEKWRRPLETEVPYSYPVVAKGRLYLNSMEGDLLALDVDDGSGVWRRNLGSGPVGPVALADDTVIVPGPGNRLQALAADDGHEKWSRSLDAGSLRHPAVADGIVYLGIDHILVAIDASNGEVRWQFETREVHFGDYTSSGINPGIAVVDGIVFAATGPGDLYALKEK